MYRGKRALDLALTIFTAPLWVPLLGVIALLVRVNLGAPIFFRQPRPGRNEVVFQLIKFRSMTDSRDTDGQPKPDAERLTPFGRRLRALSLDELPELINVLAGDMSLVGPRPLLIEYLPRYSQRHRRRHLVQPGLTGLAQVSGRNSISWTEKFDLDLEYVEKASVGLDLMILFQTIVIVFQRRGISADGSATMPAFQGYDELAGHKH